MKSQMPVRHGVTHGPKPKQRQDRSEKVGAQVEMVIASEAALAALGTCADILGQGLDIDQF
jgi:hypothetical protein